MLVEKINKNIRIFHDVNGIQLPATSCSPPPTIETVRGMNENVCILINRKEAQQRYSTCKETTVTPTKKTNYGTLEKYAEHERIWTCCTRAKRNGIGKGLAIVRRNLIPQYKKYNSWHFIEKTAFYNKDQHVDNLSQT